MTYRSANSTGVAPREWPESRRSRLELAVVPAAVRIARYWTADQLAGTGPGPGPADPDLVDSAVLAVSELVTNAIAAVSQDAAAGRDWASGQNRAVSQDAVAGRDWASGQDRADGQHRASGQDGAGGRHAAADLACAAAARPGLALAGTALVAAVAASCVLPTRILSFGDLTSGQGLPGPVAALGAALSAGLPPPSPPPPPPPCPRVSLVISRMNMIVRIEVHDSSRVPLPPTCRRDAEDETGRGLLVVAALAENWGWQPEPFGKVVWCELAN